MTTKIGVCVDRGTCEHQGPEARQYRIDALHGLLDEKGRTVGGYALVEGPCLPGVWHYPGATFVRDEGKPEFFEVRIYASRAGQKFGAIPRGTRYPTLDAAKAAAVKKLTEQGRRYAKTYGPHKMQPASGLCAECRDDVESRATCQRRDCTGRDADREDTRGRTLASPPNKSWAPEVIADSSGKWCGNALRFATKEEAEANVRELSWRWMLVRETRVVESADPVNYAWDMERGLVDLRKGE